jgi:uncharacterized OsmC-like protein
MQGDEGVREALERNASLLSARPGKGQLTATTKAVLRPGLECSVTEGPHTLTVAMTTKYAGTGGGPNPGVLGRAALASCLAICYGMWSARLGIPLDSLEVEVSADFDVRGELGVSDDVRPGYGAVRYVVTATSTSSEADVLRVLDTADRYSPYRDIFATGVPLTREVRISAAAS